ncbi:MAG: hypothetical protein DLM63_05560 [Solirubrobacterales bacterium]|nr:MAG: hypothetical protein DLM63_05560 [Solirubrobacterales bacterium]
MARRVAVERSFIATVTAAEALWYDPERWASWIDGFGHVARLSEQWPEVGATLAWDSLPGGRGRVVERVEAYTPGRGQRLRVEDERLEGLQQVGFADEPDGCLRVGFSLEYSLKQGGPLRPLVDFFFIKRALTDSLTRTLVRFGIELQSDL